MSGMIYHMCPCGLRQQRLISLLLPMYAHDIYVVDVTNLFRCPSFSGFGKSALASKHGPEEYHSQQPHRCSKALTFSTIVHQRRP